MIAISHSGNVLQVNGRKIALEFAIKESYLVGQVVVVLLDPDSNLGKDRQFRNLLGFDKHGNQIWVAELPTDKISDVYYKVASWDPLTLYSFCSYQCVLDSATGKILEKSFLK